jgi:2-succinyl-6-hydroxy-2,4-cyclohexadiene-1-carboxylate synthase
MVSTPTSRQEPACCAPPLAGHGQAPLARTWREQIERVERWLEREQARPAHLVGYSLGGRIGWGLLEAAPERFASATLIGAHPGLRTDVERAARRASDERWIRLLEDEGVEAFVRAWEAIPLWSSQRRLPPSVLDAQRAIRLSHRAAGLASAMRALGLAEMPPVDVEAIQTPTQLVVGELDDRHLALSAAVVERSPRIRRRVVEDVGHNVLLERPDAIAAILAREEAA